ncbi:MAG: ABC transporter permease [Candidatus Korobacteraceae bacterium]
MSYSQSVERSDSAVMTEPAAAQQEAAVGLPANLPKIRIQATRGWAGVGLRDLKAYKGLLYFLAWRDIKVRYKQTVLGATWALLQPLFLMILFTLLFHRVAKVPTPVPYPVFAFAGLLPWQLFAFGLNESSNSLVANQRLITKIYFPRVIMPLSAIVAGLVDFGIGFMLLLAMMVWYGVMPTAAVLLLPLFLGLIVLTSLSVGLWLSALNVKYRDVRYTLGFLVQFWMLATPVGYPVSVVPEQWRALYGLNPMAGVVEGFRWALLGTGNPPGYVLAVSVAMVLVMFFGGLEYFRRMERTFADIV